jgi:3-isopropylmalate/(R)-2-methylmalate dehydratase large subunit
MGKTLTGKIFEAHLVDEPAAGAAVIRLDLVLCHEITTPIAINDLVRRGKDRVFDRERVKAVIDHVTPAKDTKSAVQGKILREWARRQELSHFYDIGENGVCHALFPEKGFVRPGMTVIMGDSHTCTLGAFGAFAAGVGTTDLEVGILKGVTAFREPSTLRVNIDGTLGAGVYAKDAMLEVIRQLTMKGATDRVIEFGGSVVDRFAMDERMTLCNMAIEAGGTSGVCMPDATTRDYLWPHIAGDYDNDPEKALAAFREWHSDPDAEYARTLTVEADALEPVTTVGYRPDQVVPLRTVGKDRVDQVYIGSCTNGRLPDLHAAAAILKGRHLAKGVRGIVSPSTPAIFRAALEDGTLGIFLDAGFSVTNPTCGACLGMSNGVLAPGEVCASTTNRNFYGRMGEGGLVHLMSPASAAATAVTGTLTDPREFLQA